MAQHKGYMSPSLLHRIVYVYDPKKIIYLAMLHPSGFFAKPKPWYVKSFFFPLKISSCFYFIMLFLNFSK